LSFNLERGRPLAECEPKNTSQKHCGSHISTPSKWYVDIRVV